MGWQLPRGGRAASPSCDRPGIAIDTEERERFEFPAARPLNQEPDIRLGRAERIPIWPIHSKFYFSIVTDGYSFVGRGQIENLEFSIRVALTTEHHVPDLESLKLRIGGRTFELKADRSCQRIIIEHAPVSCGHPVGLIVFKVPLHLLPWVVALQP